MVILQGVCLLGNRDTGSLIWPITLSSKFHVSF